MRGKKRRVTERVPPHWKVKLDGTVGGQLPARPLGTLSGGHCNRGQDVLFGKAFWKDQTAAHSGLRDGVSGPRTPESPGRTKPPPLLALSAGRLSTEQAGIPLLPRELVPPGQGWDTVARGGWGWLALPLPVLYLFCG